MRKLVGLAACLVATACGSEFDSDIGSTEDPLVSPQLTEKASSVHSSRLGNLTVRVSPETGQYMVREAFTGAVMVRETVGSGIHRLPMGSYVVTFKPIFGFVVPASEIVVTLSLSKQSDSVAFEYGVAPTDAGATRQDPGLGYGLKRLDDDHFEISRVDQDIVLEDPGDLLMQTRIVPAFKDGEPIGFKLFSIRPGSFYEAIGIRNGDVVLRINGFEVNSPDKALEVYVKLKESSRIDIELDRNGSQVAKTLYVTH